MWCFGLPRNTAVINFAILSNFVFALVGFLSSNRSKNGICFASFYTKTINYTCCGMRQRLKKGMKFTTKLNAETCKILDTFSLVRLNTCFKTHNSKATSRWKNSFCSCFAADTVIIPTDNFGPCIISGSGRALQLWKQCFLHFKWNISLQVLSESFSDNYRWYSSRLCLLITSQTAALFFLVSGFRRQFFIHANID